MDMAKKTELIRNANTTIREFREVADSRFEYGTPRHMRFTFMADAIEHALHEMIVLFPSIPDDESDEDACKRLQKAICALEDSAKAYINDCQSADNADVYNARIMLEGYAYASRHLRLAFLG